MEVWPLSPSGRKHLIYSIYSMTTLLDYKKTLAYLAYLGFPGESTAAALKVTQPRKSDRRKGKSSRNVFLCYVCGAAGSGKTSLLRLFAGKPYRDVYVPTTKPISVVNSVEIDGIEKYLVVRPLDRRHVLLPSPGASVVPTLTWPLYIALLLQMQEFGSNYEAETLRNSKRTDLADVIVYIYDSSDTNSFSYISNLRVSISPPPT